MLPFENMVVDYVKETENHVLYRVTPVFEGNNLVASGVQIEAQSVEDQGEGILFNVYCYNVQPGVTIDYATGDSTLAENAEAQSNAATSNDGAPQQNAETQSNAATSNEAASQQETTTQDGTAVQGAEENSSDHATDASGAAVSNDTGAGGSGSVMVWKSATGSKYHSTNHCGNMNPDNATQITEEEAIREGLGKCKKCW